MLPLVRKVIETFNHHDYHIYREAFKLNLVAIRKDDARERLQHYIKSPLRNEDALFFDQLLLFYFDEHEKLEFSLYEYATLPFITNHETTQVLMPNQYKESFILKDNLLQQHDSLDMFEDDFSEKRPFFDPFSMKSGNFNMCIGNRLDIQAHHKFKNKNAYQEFLELCQIHINYYQNSFSYTLLDEHTLIQKQVSQQTF